MSAEDGLRSFVEFLYDEFCGDAVVLVAHNGLRFDAKVLKTSLARYGIAVPQLITKYWCFADSMTLPSADGQGGRSLQALMRRYLGNRAVQTHEALDDAEQLGKVIKEIAEERKLSLLDLLASADRQWFCEVKPFQRPAASPRLATGDSETPAKQSRCRDEESVPEKRSKFN